MNVQIEESWREVLGDEFEMDYFKKLLGKVGEAYLSDATIFPPKELIFNAFEQCSFEKLKVVILGQDPYHGKGQAHGLSFSVPDGIQIPPSLQNIYKEINTTINTSINCGIPVSGNLEHWADQGVLLLNATLTVEENNAGSHQKLGWETFTDTIIQKISDQKEHIVFLLWGAYAQEKGKNIDTTQHLVL
ncbi:MAG: uracil-DNA glycosylase, partial [Acidimicrobiales bacterium]